MKLQHQLYFLISLIIFMASCSPKVIKQATDTTTPEEKKINKPAEKFTEAQISLLIPFKLNQLNLKNPTKAGLAKADMAVDFYQGLMLGIDSASNSGFNFKVNVFDTRDDNVQLANVLKNQNIKKSNLIIGPVYPEGQKYMTNFAIANRMPVVSPLAATKPADIANPNLISIANNIDQHGAKIASYIASHFQSGNGIIVLINTKSATDEQLATPIKNYFKTNHPNFLVQEYNSTYAFETRMVKGKKYAVVLCSADAKFVKPSLLKLYKLKNLPAGGYDMQLFGHPNWIKQTYAIEQLQDLKTVISSAYKIDYKATDVIKFIKQYRAKYNFEPSEYAFKGFDIGFYFANLIAKHGGKYLDYLSKEKYKGLHNTFDFDFNPQYGYFNKDLLLLQYKNFALNKVD
jgi:hypothetical protein